MVQETIKLDVLCYIISVMVEFRVIFIFENHYR